MPYPEINFCRRCGTQMELRVPPMEDRERASCPACDYIDYVNPNNVVGTVPVWYDDEDEGQILLCRRNIEPRKGFWTLPAGFLEYGETMREGAIRETREEAGARVALGDLLAVYDVVHAGQVHVFYRAELLDLDLAPGPETIENKLFYPDEIPWDELSFRTVRRALQFWVSTPEPGAVDTGSITPPSIRSEQSTPPSQSS